MNTVTVSPKYQVVIPLEVRERNHIRVGERLQVISFDDRIELIPVRPMRSMRGCGRGARCCWPRRPLPRRSM